MSGSGISITLQWRKVQNSNRLTGESEADHGASIDRVRGYRTLQEVEGSPVSQDTTEKLSSGSQLPLPLSRAPKQAGNTQTTCLFIVGRTVANPPDHKCMTSRYMTDVFGGAGALAKKDGSPGFAWPCA